MKLTMKRSDTKITLKLKQEAIQKAKAYAKRHKESLSRLVERYFESVCETQAPAEEPATPIVKELSGVVRMKKGAAGRKLYAEYIAKKYSK